MNHETIIIVDFGGYNNSLLARQIREQEVYCEIIPFYNAIDVISKTENLKGLILTGNIELCSKNMPVVDEKLLFYSVPIMGLGYGSIILKETENNDNLSSGALESYLFDKCGCTKDWTPASYVKNAIAHIKRTVGDRKVLCALSGGVDSTVCAVLTHRAIGDALTCVFVDHGLMRKNEGDNIMRQISENYNLKIIRVNAKDRFLAKLKGVSDPEQKRKIIGGEFIEVFTEESEKLGTMDFLLQGTIYADIIESGVGGAVVKSHHNVGGLPEQLGFELLEPLRQLFKDEVRKVGIELGIPTHLVYRQPFPGPGLGVRCLGEVTEEKLEILREADAILLDEIAKAGLDKKIWQYFAVLPGIKSVGVKNDKRTYSYAIGIRAVHSIDAMTAEWARIPYDVLEKISNRILAEVSDVNRILYDITPKPPGTIEWE